MGRSFPVSQRDYISQPGWQIRVCGKTGIDKQGNFDGTTVKFDKHYGWTVVFLCVFEKFFQTHCRREVKNRVLRVNLNPKVMSGRQLAAMYALCARFAMYATFFTTLGFIRCKFARCLGCLTLWKSFSWEMIMRWSWWIQPKVEKLEACSQIPWMRKAQYWWKTRFRRWQCRQIVNM